MKKPIVGLLLGLALQGAGAHEWTDNRATLVLRDRTHLSATLYVTYSEVLHRVLAPTKKYQDFLVKYSAIDPAQFERELLRAQSTLQAGTKIYGKDGADFAIKSWHWPDAAQVQGAIRARTMQAVREPGSHAHEAPMEIRVDLSAGQEIQSVAVQFPDAFQKMLVVSYRPNQVWVESTTKSPPISF